MFLVDVNQRLVVQLIFLEGVQDVRFGRIAIVITGNAFKSDLDILLKTRPLSALGVNIEITGLCKFLSQSLHLFSQGFEILRVILVDLHLHL